MLEANPRAALMASRMATFPCSNGSRFSIDAIPRSATARTKNKKPQAFALCGHRAQNSFVLKPIRQPR
jgi:hypothetical protein